MNRTDTRISNPALVPELCVTSGRQLEAGKYCLRPDVASVLSSDKEAILRRLGKNIKPFV
jgi:hypothetical protein